jgi:hypothetical protein
LEELKQREITEALGDPPTETEFKKALWNGKLPGESGITPEAIKGLDHTHSNIMFEFLTLSIGQIPRSITMNGIKIPYAPYINQVKGRTTAIRTTGKESA